MYRMRVQIIMAAVKKGSSGVLERVPSAGTGIRNKPKETPVRGIHPNSSPVYKTQSDTSLTAGLRNLTINDNVSNGQKRTLSAKANDKVKNLTDAATLLHNEIVKNIVVVAGAGISTPSGIPDFRSPGTGLYDNLQQYQIPYPEAIFDIDYFHQNPRPFFTLAKELYPSGKYRPNYIHYFVRLLHDKGMLLRMYTQNIDGLERLAGVPADKLVEAHGTFATATCTVCRQKYEGSDIKEKIFTDKLPRCPNRGCMGIVKPDIVFFGEDLPRKFYSYMKDMLQADLVLVMGTSLEVQPFAGIIDTVQWKVPRILFNREAVGPFRRSKRSQDLVAAGDLVDTMVKFATLSGWKTDMVELITKEEGTFKLHYKKTAALPPKPKAKTEINKKPPQKPQQNQKRNYSNMMFHQSAKIGMFGNDSSSEETTESESDETSSDSSEEENRNRRYVGVNRGKLLTNTTKNGALAGRNGYRSSSAKLGNDNSRKLHTERNLKSGKTIGGNLTGRSVKSESGMNVNISKRQFDNNKRSESSGSLNNTIEKNGDKKSTETKAERDRVLRKYGLSPNPNTQATKNRENDKVRRKNGPSPNSNTQITQQNSEKDKGVRKYSRSPKTNVELTEKKDRSKRKTRRSGNSKTPVSENGSEKSQKSVVNTAYSENGQNNESTEEANENKQEITETKNIDNSQSVNSVSGYFIEDVKTKMLDPKISEQLENISETMKQNKTAPFIGKFAENVKRNETFDDSVIKIGNAAMCENTSNQNHGNFSSHMNRLADDSLDKTSSKTLSENAAKSFRRYAKLNAQRRVIGNDGGRNQLTSGQATKPPLGSRITSEAAQQLQALNTRPYGYGQRNKAPVKGIGPFQRTSKRTLNSAFDYTQNVLRSVSAELPKISYRHNIQPTKTYAQLFGSQTAADASSDEVGVSSDDSR